MCPRSSRDRLCPDSCAIRSESREARRHGRRTIGDETGVLYSFKQESSIMFFTSVCDGATTVPLGARCLRNTMSETHGLHSTSTAYRNGHAVDGRRSQITPHAVMDTTHARDADRRIHVPAFAAPSSFLNLLEVVVEGVELLRGEAVRLAARRSSPSMSCCCRRRRSTTTAFSACEMHLVRVRARVGVRVRVGVRANP